MISLLAKLFLKTDGKSESDLRKTYGILCGAVGIGLNILLFLLKFWQAPSPAPSPLQPMHSTTSLMPEALL